MGPIVRNFSVLLFLCIPGLLISSPASHREVDTRSFLLPPGVIIIDPGHGGRDPGAAAVLTGDDGSTKQVYEKDINLAIALRLKDILEQQAPETAVILTRNDDSYISLQQRVQTANTAVPPPGTSRIYISIHANAAPVNSARGFEVWTYRGQKVSRFVKSGVDDPFMEALALKLDTLVHRELLDASDALADQVLISLRDELSEMSPSRGIKEQDFYVIKFTRMPAVLVEAGFMSNPEELKLLVTDHYQEKIAQALAAAVLAYSESLQ